MAAATIYDILPRLREVKQTGRDKWMALCPIHDDHHASLSVKVAGNDKVLLHCFGCKATYPDLMAAIGLSANGNGVTLTAATPVKPKAKPAPRTVATYDYHDADGQVVFQKVRYEPKSFAIRRPSHPAGDGNGSCVWGLGDMVPVLYRLPQLIDPATDWQPVYVCEGEKDVDRVTGLGLVATCNFDGAGKWRVDYNRHFASRVVYVLADNDDAGRAHAEIVARNLHSVAKRVKVVNLPDLPLKGDVSDWLDAGHTKEELERECLLSPIWKPAADDSSVPQSPNGAAGDSAAATTVNLMSYRPEDGGICDLWHDLYGGDWIYVTGFEEWHKWVGTHWRPDTGGYGLKAQVADVLDGMNRQARLMKESADDKTRERLTPYVNATKRTAARVASVEGLARLRCYMAADKLDAADMINLANGTLDLSSGQLSAHDPADCLTYCLPYAFDPAADAPNWQAFLSRLDGETADFLQEYAGYALTSDCRFELALWLYGPPGGGKSTFIAGLQAVLGPKATVLGLADIERNRFALANLPGKTLAVATEQPADYLASTHVLNALISGEPVIVDRKYTPAVTITPRVKLAWALNELPRVRDAGDGIFRRVKVVEFPTIPDHERRPEMKEAIAGEAAGILNWALAGSRRLRARGRFVIPATIEAASRAFAQQNDIPAVFVEECCGVGPTLSVQSSALYNRYQTWCIENGHKPQSSTSIANEWRRLGFERRKTAGGMIWDGVALKT